MLQYDSMNAVSKSKGLYAGLKRLIESIRCRLFKYL